MLVLDPTLDIVFKLMLTQEPVLLVDMLQGVLGRNVSTPTVLNPGILGAQVRNKQVGLDLRVALDDGSRADLEMQRRVPANLAARLVYYGTRDYSGLCLRRREADSFSGQRLDFLGSEIGRLYAQQALFCKGESRPGSHPRTSLISSVRMS